MLNLFDDKKWLRYLSSIIVFIIIVILQAYQKMHKQPYLLKLLTQNVFRQMRDKLACFLHDANAYISLVAPVKMS